MATKQKVSEVVKTHKKEIAVAAVAAIGGAALVAVGIKYGHDIKSLLPDNGTTPKGTISDWSVGDCCNYETYDNGKVVEFWLDNVKIEDTGKLGEEIVSKIPNLPDNAKMWAIVNISEKTN